MFGEVFLCRFPFTSGAAVKQRPALVLFDLGEDALICRVTSIARSGSLDVSLADWERAGLAKPSVVRLDRLVTADKSILARLLGRLTDRDANAVRQAWNEKMRL